jgi:hypothetical protein
LVFLTKKGPQRKPVTREELQSVIADAVKKSDPVCGPFIGVVIERTAQSGVTSNWAIRGVKFGTADREKSSQALNSIVEILQREFLLSEDNPESEKDAAPSSIPKRLR